MFKSTYYEINEKVAKKGFENHHITNDYAKNSQTNKYKCCVDNFVKMVENLYKNKANPNDLKEWCQSIIDRYSKKLSDFMNKINSLDAQMPSLFVAGPANYPVEKAEKLFDRKCDLWNENGNLFKINGTNYYIRKINKKLQNATIYSNDKNATKLIQDKIAFLEEKHNYMLAFNEHEIKYGNMENFERQAKFEENLYTKLETCFTYHLRYNKSEIKRLKERLKEIEKMKNVAPATNENIKQNGVKMVQNQEIMRVQLIFDGKPSQEIRTILKRNAFRWSPKNNAWQRQLTANGINAGKEVLKQILTVD